MKLMSAMARVKWAIMAVIVLSVSSGCGDGEDREAKGRREVPREAVVAPEGPASQVAEGTAELGVIPGEETRTVVCWDGKEVEIPAWAEFVGNKGSGKFHRLSCQYVPDKRNQLYFKTREEAIGAGQVPCKACSP